MGSYTFLRVEVDADILERMLDPLPGVEVVESASEGQDDAQSDGPAKQATDESQAEDDGLIRALPDGEFPDEGSPVREYGLLGVGVSFVMLGAATVGIWWYRRQSTDGPPEAETPPPATTVDSETSASGPVTAPSTPSTEPTESSTVLDAAEESEDDDNDDIEWTTRGGSEPTEPTDSSDERPDSDDEPVVTGEDRRPSESVDVAPLLGVAFIAVSGAIVRWIQGTESKQ